MDINQSRNNVRIQFPCESFNISRLLTLLLIVLTGLRSAANQVNGISLGGVNPLQDAKLDELLERLFGKDNSVEETGTHIRKHFLYNLCSERIVKVFEKGRKGINARGKINGKHLEFSKLIFESTPSGFFKMFGEHTALHLCFNRKGRLVAKTNGKSKLCQFKEEYSEDQTYSHFRSADTTRLLYLGFNKKGKPLKGTDFNIKREDCFKFQKLDHNRTSNKPTCPSRGGAGPKDVDFCDKTFLEIAKVKLRHSKHHKMKGKG